MDETTQRYWDGEQWTSATAPLTAQTQQPAGAAAPAALNDKSLAVLAHLSGLIAGALTGGLGFIGPLVMWLVYREQSPFVEGEAKEALNFQLTLLIWWIVALVLALVLIGVVLMVLLWVSGIVLSIIAAVRANQGQPFRYPLTIRFVS